MRGEKVRVDHEVRSCLSEKPKETLMTVQVLVTKILDYHMMNASAKVSQWRL